jgi:hypothetical protein
LAGKMRLSAFGRNGSLSAIRRYRVDPQRSTRDA